VRRPEQPSAGALVPQHTSERPHLTYLANEPQRKTAGMNPPGVLDAKARHIRNTTQQELQDIRAKLSREEISPVPFVTRQVGHGLPHLSG
jgi:hypothetical protein